MIRAISALLVTLLVTMLPAPLLAQDTYPSRTVKLIIPFPPGGLFDTVGRPLADRLKESLGTVIVENINGAGSSRGAALAARSAPDGYTLFLAGNGSHVLMPLASSKLTYDPVADFEPIALLGTASLGIAVHPSQPYEKLADLIAAARAEPEKFSYGSSGTGTLSHLTGEMFKLKADLPKLVHVPYSGGGPLGNDLLGGHVPLAMITLTPQYFDLHAAKKIRILAVTSRERLAVVPEIPTAAETLPEMGAHNFAGLFAPKGTPPEIIARIAAAAEQALKDPELQRSYAAGGFVVAKNSSPAALRSFLAGEIAQWRTIVEAVGFKIN